MNPVCFLLMQHQVNGTDTFEAFTGNPIAAAAALKEWEDNRTGPYTSSIGTHVGFARLDKELVPAADPAAGPNTPHYEIIIGVCLSTGEVKHKRLIICAWQ